MADSPVLVMVAGPNGSGKTTLTRALRLDPGVRLPHLYINADDMQQDFGLDAHVAQALAAQQRGQAVSERRDLMFETVMSHPSRLAELQRAKAHGYRVTLHFVATRDPAINVSRVALRVAAGGHAVPEDRIRRRYDRALGFAPVAMHFADQALVFDNSGSDGQAGLQLQAMKVDGRMAMVVEDGEPWVTTLVRQTHERLDERARLCASKPSVGEAFTEAQLDASATVGPITWAGVYHLVQRDERTGVDVMHDRALVGSLAVGRRVKVTYQQGVSRVV